MTTPSVEIPTLLNNAFINHENLETAFFKLSQSKQRQFIDYLVTPKQEQTKLSRLDKIIPMILNGIGLHDRYKA